MPVAEFFIPSMMIDDLNAPMNDAVEGQPWYEAVAKFMHVFESVRHAVKSCARCTGSPYALVSATTNRKNARDKRLSRQDRITIPVHPGRRLNNSTVLLSTVSLRDAQIQPHGSPQMSSTRPLVLPLIPISAQPVTPNPLQPKGHLRGCPRRGCRTTPGRVTTLQPLHFPDKENTVPLML